MDGEAQRLTAHFRHRVVLVTGAFGFIGQWVSQELARAGAEVRRLHRRPLRGNVEHGIAVEGDLREPGIWDRLLADVDTVIHLAAQTSARASELDPEADYAVNVEATRRLAEASRRSGRKLHVLFAGTVTQRGRAHDFPLSGDEHDEPISYYDLHKLIAEELLEFHARRGAIVATTLRLPTVYGPGEAESSLGCGVVNTLVRMALAGKPLTIYGDGERLRDFVFVEDVTRAFLLTALAPDRCNGRHFLLGSGAPVTVKNLVQLIASIVERETSRAVPVVHVDPPADELEIAKCGFSVDNTALERATGFRPHRSLADGLTETVRYFRKSIRPSSEQP